MKNILILATHGSYYVPDRNLFALSDRLLKNFSDFGTAELLAEVPDEQKIVCPFSRALGDPNREVSASDIFREKDFNGNTVWKEFPNEDAQKVLVQEFHEKYHAEVRERIATLQPSIIFDVHDTGDWLLGEEDRLRDPPFPQICISNCEGKTASNEFMNNLVILFEKHLGITPQINNPYKGGHVTRTYGDEAENVVQIEFHRGLYMDERTQEIIPEKMKRIREGFMKIFDEI